eukprot:3633474-Prymnesium_polylepis.1
MARTRVCACVCVLTGYIWALRGRDCVCGGLCVLAPPRFMRDCAKAHVRAAFTALTNVCEAVLRAPAAARPAWASMTLAKRRGRPPPACRAAPTPAAAATARLPCRSAARPRRLWAVAARRCCSQRMWPHSRVA